MTLEFKCPCGETRWSVTAPKTGTRLVCYCNDCQTGARHLKADVLNEGGGTDLLQVAAHQVRFEGPPLEVMRLSPRGLMRWHTSCCNAPVCNTIGTAKMSFAGLLVAHVADDDAPIPKVTTVANSIYAQGRPGVPAKDKRMVGMILGILKRALVARLSGKWRDTPFFKAPDWAPVAEPRVLTKEERNAARP